MKKNERKTYHHKSIDFLWNTADILHRPLNTDHLFLSLGKWRNEAWELAGDRQSIRNGQTNKTWEK
jgi:hypothetical protein